MLLLLSPAKTLDFETPVPAKVLKRATEPAFAGRAAELIEVLRRKSITQVAALMDLSPALATLNVARYADWQAVATPANSKPALLAFAGDVYTGLQAPTLTAADLAWAQEHLVILSGLYGLLRPLDRLQPYRLEMGTSLSTRQGRDLYAWWGDRLAQALNDRQADEAAPVIVNLASVEYARAVLRPALRARVVDCVFEDWKAAPQADAAGAAGPAGNAADGQYKVISFFAKKARGMMARHAIERRARSPRALEGFAADGYRLAPEVSTPERLVFRRRQPP